MQNSHSPRFEAITRREEGLRRTLTSRQLSMIAIGGAIGTGLFLGSKFAISLAGPSVLLSYCIGGLITLLLMGCLAEMTVAHPTSGSFGAWAEFYISPLAGFLVRFALLGRHRLCARHRDNGHRRLHALLVSISARVFVDHHLHRDACPHQRNQRRTIRHGRVLLLCIEDFRHRHLRSSCGVACDFQLETIITTVRDDDRLQELLRLWRIFPKSISGMWVAVLVSLFSYFSIEMIAIAAGEAKDPQRAITHAFRATMLRLALFYLCTLALVLAVVPWTMTAAGGTQSPFVLVMTRTHIAGAAAIVNFVILVAALSAMNSQLYISTRMLFSLSRAGFAPRRLGSLSPKGVPLAALLVSTLGIALAAVLNARYHDRAFLMMLAIAMFGPMFTWFMIFITHLAFRRRHAQDTLAFRMWGYPYTSIVGAVLMLAALCTTLFTPEFRPALLYGIPFLTILSIAYALRHRAPSPVERRPIEEIHPT